MINKIVFSKLFLIILISILAILLLIFIILIQPNKGNKSNKIDQSYKNISEKDEQNKNIDIQELISIKQFELKGDDKISIFLGDTYIEEGFIAIDSQDNDLSSEVIIEGTVDTKALGTYTIKYILSKYDIELTREVEIVEKSKPVITLNGEKEVYILKGEIYNELGAEVIVDGENKSTDVVISGKVDTSKVGVYTLIYSYEDIYLERKVIVFDIDSLFKIKNDNQATSVSISLNDNIKYIIMPDGVLNESRNISYKITKNGIYNFYIYMKSDQKFEKKVVVDTIVEYINVDSISLNKSKLTLSVGDSQTLSIAINPANATNKEVIWSSTNKSIAEVKNGVITAKKAGDATITVQTSDGLKKATCLVIVKSKSLYDSSVTQKYVFKESNKYAYKKEANNETYITVKTDISNVLKKIGKQGPDQCRVYSKKYVTYIFEKVDVSHTSSSRLRTKNKQTMLSMMATELLKGRPSVIRVTGMKKSGNKYSRHYVTVVGIKEKANLKELKETDFLILDPHGYIRQLGQGQKGNGTSTSGRYLLDGSDKTGSADRPGYQIYIWASKAEYLKISGVLEDPE